MYTHKSYETSPAIWITQCYLPPDTGERAPPNPSQKCWYSINLPHRDGRLSWPRWLVIPWWFTRQQMVTHPSINRAWRRLTTLIETNAWRPGPTILFHGQEWNVATEPSLWPAQLYGTVYQQECVELTACIHLSASSKLICLLYVLMTDYLFLQTFVMHSRAGAE